MADIACFHNGADRLGECPIWSVAEQALYWIDSRAPAIYRAALDGAPPRRCDLDSVIGSIAFRAKGGLIAATAGGIFALDFDSGEAELLAHPEAEKTDNRFNDGRCDRRGRFWCGTMSDVARDPVGTLYRLDADHSVQAQRNDIIVPNSIAWSPDERVMYFADTYRGQILAYPYDADEGALGEARHFAAVAGPGRPDGSAVDAEGCLWNAEYAGGRLVRYRPDGRIDRVIEMPVSQPTCCCFGGPDLKTLFVTSATQRLDAAQLAQQPLAGAVFAIDAGVEGLPEPAYAG